MAPADYDALTAYLQNPLRRLVPDAHGYSDWNPPTRPDMPSWDSTEDIEAWLTDEVAPWQRMVLAVTVLELHLPAWEQFARRDVDDRSVRQSPARAVATLWNWIHSDDDDRGTRINELRPVRRQLEDAQRYADDFGANARVMDSLRNLYSIVAFLLLDLSGDIDELVSDDTALFEDIVDALSNLSSLDCTLPVWWRHVTQRLAFCNALAADLE